MRSGRHRQRDRPGCLPKTAAVGYLAVRLGKMSDAELPDESVISAITLAELSVGPHLAGDDTERSARQQHLQQAEADFDVLPFDGDCARAFGAVAAALRASGRKPATRRMTRYRVVLDRARVAALDM